jgi:NAD(P)-dependent dehydrogenase (short-subunit alcohol dehydrogenase family)
VTPSADRPVLITGCSSGIGAATAERLVRRGHRVVATARDVTKLRELAALGAWTRALDVTDEGSMRSVVDEIVSEAGAVGALVNNAGAGAYGSIEETPIDRVRTEFETNVFGGARLIQLVLPAMRAAGGGRIVNMSSMGGRLTLPFGGYYHASKHALEALSDALRYEVAPFGVFVSLIEPGIIRTRFGSQVTASLSESTPADSPYALTAGKFDEVMAGAYRNRWISSGPERVAKAVEAALTADRPRTRYVVTPAARALITTRALSPGRVWDRFVTAAFGV